MGADRFSDGHFGYVSGEPRSEETDVSTDDAGGTTTNDVGGADDMLSPMEATDSDEVHNADGDEVVDAPDDWTGADKFGMSAEEERQGETLDQRLAEEEPDVTVNEIDPHPAGGAPEDGDSLFPVVE